MDEYMMNSLEKLRSSLRDSDNETLRDVLFTLDLIKNEIQVEIGRRDATKAYEHSIKKIKNQGISKS